MSAISKRFGDALRKHRTLQGLSQESLAEKSGLHPTYIGMVERGLRSPTLAAATKMARALRVEILKLIEEAEPVFDVSIFVPSEEFVRGEICKMLRAHFSANHEGLIFSKNLGLQSRAKVLFHANGQCQACGRTVSQHGIVLLVVGRVPLSSHICITQEDHWALCDYCNRLFQWSKHTLNSRSQCFNIATAHARIASVLVANRSVWIPAVYLQSIARVNDFTRCMAKLKDYGMSLQIKTFRSPHRRTNTCYRLSRW
jgi:transcriptional regulator with XRE-family HTH domain